MNNFLFHDTLEKNDFCWLRKYNSLKKRDLTFDLQWGNIDKHYMLLILLSVTVQFLHKWLKNQSVN